MRYEICVELKPEVLDTEGRAIQESLRRLGHKDLSSLKVTKRFVVEFDNKCSDPEKVAEKIAHDYLANPISEQYQIKRIDK